MHVVYFDQCLGAEHSFFSWNKTFHLHFGENLKNPFFVKFISKFLTFLNFFSFLVQKMLKMHFLPVVGVPRTQTLVKIYNRCITLYIICPFIFGFQEFKASSIPRIVFLETKTDKFAIAKSNDKYLRSKAVKLLSWTK